MFRTVYVRFNGDLYEITADVLGDIVQAVAYYDNRNRVGERLAVEHLPPEVFLRAQTELSKLWSKND